MAHILGTVAVLALLLGVLVVFHELGHFIVARLARMKVDEFAFGFGPVLARLFRRGDTQFNIRAFPLGGFVRIAGMEPGDETPGGFNAAPAWHRLVVVLAGPFMSLLLGYLIFSAVGMIWGLPTGRAMVAIVDRGTPAARAGLRPGDVIYGIDGKRSVKLNELIDRIHASPGREVTLLVRRGGGTITIRAIPDLRENPALQGATPDQRKQLMKERGFKEKVGLLGFRPKSELRPVGVFQSIRQGTVVTYDIVVSILRTLFSRRIAKDVGGIVMIGYMTQEVVKEGTQAVLFELAALSIMLGILNLILFPVLDGGHILYLIIEKIRGKKLEPERWYAIQTVGLAVLVTLAVFLVYLDIHRIATGNFPR